ncbi:MAG: SEFIR domain-containing protein [Nostoc sp.]
MEPSQAIGMNEQAPIKVFISYSWDSKEHKDKVLSLAQALRDDGIDCMIDQFVQSPDNWERWMLDQIDESKFVIIICSHRYYRRYRGKEEVNKGLGVTWESILILGKIYDSQGRDNKFYPIFFDTPDKKIVPDGIRSTIYDLSRYDLFNLDKNENRLIEDGNYKELYRLLTSQPFVIPKKIGSLKKLPVVDRGEPKPIIPESTKEIGKKFFIKEINRCFEDETSLRNFFSANNEIFGENFYQNLRGIDYKTKVISLINELKNKELTQKFIDTVREEYQNFAKNYFHYF